MKKMFFAIALLATLASAAEPLADFIASAKHADRVELSWRDDIPAEKIGIKRLKQQYVGQEKIDAALSHLRIDSQPHPASGVDEDGTPWFDREALICQDEDHFTHRLRAFSHGDCIAELLVSLDGRHVALIDKKEMFRVTDDTLAWLRTEADWDSDMDAVKAYEQKTKANQIPEPTPTGVAHR